MAEVRIQQAPEHEQQQTPRQKAKADRLRVVAENNTARTVQVWAANEDMRRVLRHPTGTRFRDDIGTPVEWPYDSFTYRRIAQGDVTTGGPASPKEVDPSLGPRAAAAARRPEKIEPRQPVSAVDEQPQPQQQPAGEQPQPQPSQKQTQE